MSDFAAITTDVAEWLTVQPLHSLPPIWGVQITDGAWLSGNKTVEAQLASSGKDVAEKLLALAQWAEHLDVEVTVTDCTGHSKAQVVSQTHRGYGISLWDHLDPTTRAVLDREGCPTGSVTTAIPATALRNAAARLSHEGTCPECGH